MASGDARTARKYAKALFDLFRTNGAALDEVDTALAEFAALLKQNSDLYLALTNPVNPDEERIQAADDVLKAMGAHEQVRNLAALLIENDRLQYINEVYRSFRRLVNDLRRVAEIQLWTARDLEDGERAELESRIRRDLEPEFADLVKIEFLTDSSLIGGLQVRLGDKLLDSSLRGTLERMRKTMGG